MKHLNILKFEFVTYNPGFNPSQNINIIGTNWYQCLIRAYVIGHMFSYDEATTVDSKIIG